MESLVAGMTLRLLQALLQATPTILIGLLVAGLFRRLLGHSGTRRLFGENSWRALPQAWLIGMLLPVCSLGVMPILREMRRAGISGGTLLAFGLTAPLFNPISVLYGLTLADPVVILTFSLCSLGIVTAVGLCWDWVVRAAVVAEPEPPAVAYGIKRMVSVSIHAARDLFSSTSLYILAGLIGVAMLSAILPHGALQKAAEPQDSWAPLFMAAIAVPAYATPMTAMVQLASMFQHGNSVGAAFALLVLGAGMNVGLTIWIIHAYGWRTTMIWFAILFGIVVGLAYGIDKPLYPHGVQSAGHTHAFDIYCHPFPEGAQGTWAAAATILWEGILPHELVASLVLVVFFLTGLTLHCCDPQRRCEAWLERIPAPTHQATYDLVLSPPALGLIALVGLLALSILGCFVYYPPPADIFEEMRIINTEVTIAATTQDWETALYWIPIYDDWTRKLQVSMFLRGDQPSRYFRAKANVVRDKLEWLEHELEDREAEPARELAWELQTAYRRLRQAYDHHRNKASSPQPPHGSAAPSP